MLNLIISSFNIVLKSKSNSLKCMLENQPGFLLQNKFKSNKSFSQNRVTIEIKSAPKLKSCWEFRNNLSLCESQRKYK